MNGGCVQSRRSASIRFGSPATFTLNRLASPPLPATAPGSPRHATSVAQPHCRHNIPSIFLFSSLASATDRATALIRHINHWSPQYGNIDHRIQPRRRDTRAAIATIFTANTPPSVRRHRQVAASAPGVDSSPRRRIALPAYSGFTVTGFGRLTSFGASPLIQILTDRPAVPPAFIASRPLLHNIHSSALFASSLPIIG